MENNRSPRGNINGGSKHNVPYYERQPVHKARPINMIETTRENAFYLNTDRD